MIPRFEWVAIERIQHGSYQPRQHFDDASLQELATSISTHGVLQPLLLTSNYSLVAGERRWRAAQFIGLKELPCMIVRVANAQHALMSLLENIQREQIEPLEEALAFLRLQQEFAWTQEHIAKLLGKSRVHVTNMLRLLKCDVQVQQALQDKKISYGHARVLVGLTAQQQSYYVSHIVKTACSVRQLEKMVAHDKKNVAQQIQGSELYSSPHAHFIRDISDQVGTEVDLDYQKNGEGWLKFKFFDHETLEGLLKKLGLSYDE